LVALVGYCCYQLKSSAAEEILQRKSEECRIKRWQHHFAKTYGRFDNLVAETFSRMDRDSNGSLDPNELSRGLKLLGLPVCNKDLLDQVIKTMDLNGDGKVCLTEFRKAVKLWMHPYGRQNTERLSTIYSFKSGSGLLEKQEPTPLGESQVREFITAKLNEQEPLLVKPETYSEEVEKVKAEEEPDRYTVWWACWHLLVGMVLVLIFSDPMVAILGNLASKIGVGAFYVSFVITPIASNAAEIVSALYFAKSKTEAKVSMAHASLYGAACMNNTFCLAVFFLIIYFNRLPWEFTPETMCILLCEIAIAMLGYKRTIPLWKAVVAMLIYPLALVFVIIWKTLQ